MKKVLALIFVCLMLLSLCGCGEDSTQATVPSSSNQAAPSGTEGSAEATQPATNAPTTPSTQAPTTPSTQAPTTPSTQAPTTPSTQAPTAPAETQPTACSHDWKAATCSAPKTCTKCGTTEGSAAAHSWTDATCTTAKTCSKCSATEGAALGHNYQNGACALCGIEDPNVPFTNNIWVAHIVRPSGYTDPAAGEALSVYSLAPTDDFMGYSHKDYYSNPNYEGEPFDSLTYNGKTYYDYWFSSNMNGIEWDDQGNTVTVRFAYEDPVTELVLTRTGEAQFTVTASNNETRIPVGTVFTCK